MIPGGDYDHVTCRDCRAPVCDESCPSALTAERDLVLAQIDAFEDDQARTYPDERRAA